MMIIDKHDIYTHLGIVRFTQSLTLSYKLLRQRCLRITGKYRVHNAERVARTLVSKSREALRCTC